MELQVPNLGELYDLFVAKTPEATVGFLQWLAKRHQLGEAPSVLDIGCGTRRLLVPLAALGSRRVGYEPRSAYAMRARAAVRSAGTAALVRDGGFRDLAEDALFDAILAVNGPFFLVPALRGGANHCAPRSPR